MCEQDFTRNRSQSFSGVIIFMMNQLNKSITSEWQRFADYLSQQYSVESHKLVTKTAFVQYRKKIQHQVFVALSMCLIKEFYHDNDDSVKLWSGYRLVAVDGSIIELPNTKEMAKKYGTSLNQTTSCKTQGRVSVLYDILNKLCIDARLTPLATSEKQLALSHLSYTNTKDLMIYDRG